MDRPYACLHCQRRKRKCVFPSSTSTEKPEISSTPELDRSSLKSHDSNICIGCQKRNLPCSGPKRPSSYFVESLAHTKRRSSVGGPTSLSWSLASQQLSYSLSYHLVSLHVRHRPPRLFAGSLEQRWIGMGTDVASVGGKVDELSAVGQALAALGMADGARLSTHSAVIGTFRTPIPQFGTFTSADSTLMALGNRRRSAVDFLNAKAMESLDKAIESLGKEEAGQKMQLLWLANVVIVETTESRRWFRSMSRRYASYIQDFLAAKRGTVDQDCRIIYEEVYYLAMAEVLSSATFDLTTNLSQQEFISSIPLIALPPTPIYHPSFSDFNLILSPSPNPNDLTSLAIRIFTPWQLRFPKVAFIYTYGGDKIPLQKLSNLVWTAYEEITDFIDEFYARLTTDRRYLETQRNGGSGKRTTFPGLQAILQNLLVGDYILASLVIGCHSRIVASKELGNQKARMLEESQAQCWRMLRRIDFACGLRDTVLIYHELHQATLRVRQILSAPCTNISLASLPYLHKMFQFLSFSDGDCAEFLERQTPENTLSPSSVADSNTPAFSDLSQRGSASPCDSSESVFTEIHEIVEKLIAPQGGEREGFASYLVQTTLQDIGDVVEGDREQERNCKLEMERADGLASRMVHSVLGGIVV